MAMLVGPNDRQTANINVTPMIDVLLVLIIIFMVITPLSPTGFKSLVPEEPQRTQQPTTPATDIVVTVLADHTVRINQERVEIGALYARLLQIFGAFPDRVLFLRAEGDLEFRQVAEVIDIAKGAGLSRIALMPGEHREQHRQ